MQCGCTLMMDSSASPLLLALEKDGKIYVSRRKGIKQEKLLFPQLQALLAKAHAQLQDISRIFIIRGPGRFTGIRIALTFASMMQFLNHSEVKGATLFDVIYRQAVNSHIYQVFKKNFPLGAIAVVLHAFREEYFLQIFDQQNRGPQWLGREELLAQLSAYPYPLLLAGTDKDFASLTNLLGAKYPLVATKDCKVQPRTLWQMSQEDTWTENALEPLYLKPARFELIVPK